MPYHGQEPHPPYCQVVRLRDDIPYRVELEGANIDPQVPLTVTLNLISTPRCP